MNYREKIRKAIECPQLNNTKYGEWGALTLEQRKYIKRLLDELDSADNYLKKVYLENKQLKEIYKELFNTYQKLKKENEEVTSLNLHQVDKIQQLKKEIEEYKNPIKYFKYASKNVTEENQQLKDNWNKLKEIAKSQSGFKKRAGLKGGVWFEIDELLDKMLELERGDK